MDEATWITCANVEDMFADMALRTSQRKLRLFACACIRRYWAWLTAPAHRAAVEVAERFAEGLASKQELAAARKPFSPSCEKEHLKSLRDKSRIGMDEMQAKAKVGAGAGAWTAARGTLQSIALEAAWKTSIGASVIAAPLATEADFEKRDLELACQANLLREILGVYPLRPVPVRPDWLTWQGGTIPALARAAYEERRLPCGTLDPDRIGVLADALEEAGCEEAQLLGHLRAETAHWRGCFVIDALMGRQKERRKPLAILGVVGERMSC